METVVKDGYIHIRPVDNVLFCRACLATDGKLINMLENKLNHEFFRVSGIPVTQERLPPYLCVWCAAIVKRSITFRAKCIRANNCLQQCLLTDILSIRTVDRQAHNLVSLSLAELDTINIGGKDHNMPVALNPTPTANLNVTNIKLEENLNDTQYNSEKPAVNNNLYLEIDCLNSYKIKIDVLKPNINREFKTEIDDIIEVYNDDENIGAYEELEQEVIEPVNKAEKKVNIIKTRQRKAKIKKVSTEVKNKRRKISYDKKAVNINLDNIEIDDIIEVEHVDENVGAYEELEREVIEPVNEVEKKENIINMRKRKAKVKKVSTEVKNKRRIISYDKKAVNINLDNIEIDDIIEVEHVDENVGAYEELEREVIEPVNEVEKKENIINMRKRKAKVKKVNTEVKIKRRKIKNDKNAVNNDLDINAVDDKEKKSRLKKGQTKSDNRFMDLDTFKDACDVDVVILTLEDVLREVEERKASKEFKNALYPCELCGWHFRAEETYSNHREKHSEKRGPIECQVCKVRFKRHKTYHKHCGLHKFKFVCRQCGFVSRTRKRAKEHYEFHAGTQYECSYCPKVFSKVGARLQHMRFAHKTLNAVCGLCGETFVNLRLHMAYFHCMALKKADMECKTCEVTFINTPALEKHKMAAGEEHTKRFPCVQCGDTFDSVDAMKGHDDKEHPKCEDCNVTFLNASAFDTHVERKHLNIGYQHLKYQKEANRRARDHGRPLPYPSPRTKPGQNCRKPRIVCDHCGRTFQSTWLLGHHLRKIRGEKLMYACPHCPKSFFIKHIYEAHLTCHTGEKPFKCDHCGMGFRLKNNLKRHVLVVHMGITNKSVCDICKREFSTPGAVKLHVRTVHNGEPWPRRERKKTKVVSESTE